MEPLRHGGEGTLRRGYTPKPPRGHNFSDWTFFYVMVPRCHGMFPSFGEQSSSRAIISSAVATVTQGGHSDPPWADISRSLGGDWGDVACRSHTSLFALEKASHTNSTPSIPMSVISASTGAPPQFMSFARTDFRHFA